MLWRRWLPTVVTAWAGIVVLGVPLLATGPHRGLAGGLMVAGGAVSAALAVLLARGAARPIQELAEAAGRLSTGDPRPLGRRYGVADLDQIADGLDAASRRVTALLTADRELATDASHQLRTPLTALSMRLEEVIAGADDPQVVREEGSAALEQAERLGEVVTQLLGPARRAAGGTAELTAVDTIIDQQVREWEPAYRRVRRRLVVTGQAGLQAHVTPGGLSQVLATLLDNALMHGAGTVIIRRSVSPRSVVIEVEDQGKGVPPELVSRIFERSVSGRPEGTGLGLSLARTMAAADGGRVILARPKPPIFAVFLPRDAPEDHPSRPGPSRTGPA